MIELTINISEQMTAAVWRDALLDKKDKDDEKKKDNEKARKEEEEKD